MSIKETVSASQKLGRDAAYDIARASKKIIVSKGKKVTTFTVDGEPEEALLDAMLGPTGNLRAPTIRVGKTVLVGFNEEAYSDVF